MALAAHAQIRQVVASCPLVDNHCHNVVDLDSQSPYMKFYTEAEGLALSDAGHAVPFKRSIRDVAQLLNCEPLLEKVEAIRQEMGIEAFTEKFLKASKCSALLMDDGLILDAMFPLEWHRKFVPTVGRVLRIETIAQDILNKGPPGGGVSWTLDSFEHLFLSAIDPLPENVVSLKSITCYRCGLRVDPTISRLDAETGLLESLDREAGGPVRLTDSRILNFIFAKGLEVATKYDVPMQVHTGFGDKDLDLLLANPLHLRAVLEDPRFETSKIVLLHTSYPYMREASYLSVVYPQVYLDFGLVFHKLTVHGMYETCHQLLDMAPLNKVMYSADGHGLAELYYCGAKWGRETLARLLCELYDAGDLTADEALTTACDILQNNAIRLYKLDLPLATPQELLAGTSPAADGTVTAVKGGVPAAKPAPKSKAVRLMYVDYSGQRRCRVVPTSRFEDVIVEYGVGITFAHQSVTSFSDAPAEGSGLSGVGEVRLIPDLSTRCVIPWFPDHEMVMVNAYSTPGTPWEYCPRSTLIRLAATLESEFGLVMRAGFESEFSLLRATSPKPVPVDSSTYSSSAAFDAVAPFMQETADALEGMGIQVEQMHSESGQGQFEFSYAHRPALESADIINQLREAVKGVAHKHGWVATFLPHVFSNDAGNGSHIHLSITRNGTNVFGKEGARYGMSAEGEHWLAGTLEHLPAILALTAPHPNSYIRLQPNMWAGAFLCWGPENREASLRTNSPPGVPIGVVTNYELKSNDACSNPYLALAGLMAAGMDGLRRKLPLPPPVNVNPSTLSASEVERLPTTLDEAVEAFQKDDLLKEALGAAVSRAVVANRRVEAEHYRTRDWSSEVPNLVLKY